jgi:hypothetical protein
MMEKMAGLGSWIHGGYSDSRNQSTKKSTPLTEYFAFRKDYCGFASADNQSRAPLYLEPGKITKSPIT